MKNTKVLIILNDLGGGGAERVFVNIANEFADAGVEVELLLGRKLGVYFDILKPEIPVTEFKTASLLGYLKRLPAFLRENKYTHVFTASDYVTAAAILTKKRTKLPFKIIATLHYNLPYQLGVLPWPQKIWLKYLNRFVICKADEIVAVSMGVANGFKQIIRPKNCRNLRVIYNPAFDESIHEKAKENVTEDFFGNGKITLVNTGRLEMQKNHKLLINAFEKLLQKMENIQLLIIGTGSLEQTLRKQIETLGLQKTIHLIGFKKNPFAYIARSDLFVLSSSFEGLPTVLIEALALGINIVSTDCPSGPEEILESGKYGILARNNDPESLATAIEKAILNKKKAEFLMEKAALFHKKNVIPQYLKLLD